MLELCLRSDMSRTLIRLYSSIKGRESANVLVRITNAHSFLRWLLKNARYLGKNVLASFEGSIGVESCRERTSCSLY
jgi:hypothetical protein